jgi:hypothetical protein
MGINVEVKVLGKSKLPDFADVYLFEVKCSMSEYDWYGRCYRSELQRCIEHGLRLLG